jgi:predicted metal-binding membrane protein
MPLIERGQLMLLALLAVLTVVAWAWTIQQARTMDMPMGIVARGGAETEAPDPAADQMAGMDDMGDMAMDQPATDGMGTAAASGMSGMAMDEGWTWDGFATFVIAWGVMMAAMMFPAAAPMLLFFRTVSAQRKAAGKAFVSTWVFAAGYLLVWVGIGAATWVLVQIGSDLAGRLGDSDRATWAPIALGAVLIVAGFYQFTALKGVCLRQCQSPIGFVMTRWREGQRGALRMGVIHGAYCVGCCWALFAVLVATGVMSLAWMLLLTLIVFAEKVLPLGRNAPRAIGAMLLVTGVVVAIGATDLPGMA